MTENSDKPRTQIALFCDFALPYTGQMKAAIYKDAPSAQIIDLMTDVPAFNVVAASLLLAQLADGFAPGTVFVCVVDPGVGSTKREPGVVMAGGRWFVGPLNGIFEHTIRRWPEGTKLYTIDWPRNGVSSSFHGRDIFSPLAAKLCLAGQPTNEMVGITQAEEEKFRHLDFADDVEEIIYIDCFGNAVTGVRTPIDAALNPPRVMVGGIKIQWAKTFSDVPVGSAFAYGNSMGLIEVAVNRGRADLVLGLNLGSQVSVRCV